MKLVIVESPTKSKTIGQYLGKDYHVEASVGHIRDLAISGVGGFGVDVNNDFKPNYVIDKDKKDVVKKLLSLKKESDEVILATDPDREGEAIAWHLANVLDLPIEQTKRLEFHEITKTSVKNALENPRTIDLNLVHSQEARRIIDRIIGFKLSSLLRSKIRSQSAGRVQSVTLKIICEHEKEINEFVPEEYWNLNTSICKNDKVYEINLTKINDNTAKIPNSETAQQVLERTKENVHVSSIEVTNKNISSKEPFRTSTLQQECSSRFKFKTREITSIAQQLYEGVEINGELVGLITYIRTDSTKLSDLFIQNAKDYIINAYGEKYYKGSKKTKDVKLAQDAHEAIRPTNLSITPEIAKQYLNLHQYKVYKLIYERTLASLMQDKVEEVTTIEFKNSHLTFNLKGIKVVFNGFDIFKLEENESCKIPEFSKDESFELIETGIAQNFTKAPARYTEGKVIKLMEDKGIGRPSTYSSTIQTLLARKYVTLTQGNLKPTDQGILTSNVLTKYFPDLMNTEYTADMETSLDKISEGTEEELNVIKNFYFPFIEHFDEVKNQMYKEPLKTTGEKCPLCGGDLVVRNGKHGEFVGCSNFPECTYIKKDEKNEPREVGRNCPTCGSPLVYRKNRRGQEFIGCSNFPKCRYIEGVEPAINENEVEERICPDCGGKLVIKSSRRGQFYGCSNYPTCHHVEPLNKKKSNDEN